VEIVELDGGNKKRGDLFGASSCERVLLWLWFVFVVVDLMSVGSWLSCVWVAYHEE
jgi:hypothetical protein